MGVAKEIGDLLRHDERTSHARLGFEVGVLWPGGLLHMIVPHRSFVNAVADPRHVRFFHAQTFKFFCRPYPGGRLFRPLAICATRDNEFADLRQIQADEDPLSDEEVARFFD